MQYSRYKLDEQYRQQDELDMLQDEHRGGRTTRIAYVTNRTGCRMSRIGRRMSLCAAGQEGLVGG
jgi:hypothetical protein